MSPYVRRLADFVGLVASRGAAAAVDTTAVTGDGDEHERPTETAPADGVRLRAISGTSSGGDPPPSVRLRREFKGLTVADLLRDEVVERLPGQVRSALHHIERGDHAAADRALPGEFAPVLVGPGHRRARRHDLTAAVFVAGVVAAMALASWLFG